MYPVRFGFGLRSGAPVNNSQPSLVPQNGTPMGQALAFIRVLLATGGLAVGTMTLAQSVSPSESPMVFVWRVDKQSGTAEPAGSGFIFGPQGDILTAKHVWEHNPGQDIKVSIGTKDAGKVSVLDDVECDEGQDFCFLRILPREVERAGITQNEFYPLTCRRPVEGEEILAYGFLPGNNGISKPSGQTTTGIVDLGLVLTSIDLERSMSGGPVFDSSGAVIAIVKGGIADGLQTAVQPLQRAHNFFEARGKDCPKTAHSQASILVQSVRSTNEDRKETIWIRNKIERNLVELLTKRGHGVANELSTSPQYPTPPKTIYIIVDEELDERFVISANYVENGFTVSQVSIEASIKQIKSSYKSIPEAILYGLGLDEFTLMRRTNRLKSRSLAAYAFYLDARRLMEMKDSDGALERLNWAIEIDPEFAMAYWAKGQILRTNGNQDGAFALEVQAREIDPDHPKLPIDAQISEPMPSILQAASSAKWRTPTPYVRTKRFGSESYGIDVFGWSFNTDHFSVKIATQIGNKGSSVESLRRANSPSVFAINGGFFEVDSEHRLTPSGLLYVNSIHIAELNSRGGSGVFYIEGGRPKIAFSSRFSATPETSSAVQSGPLVVDPGGKLGIYENDFNRLERAAACLAGNQITFVVVRGSGLSLYEFASILALDEKSGGFGCERAINLDGGPSVQVSSSVPGAATNLKGTWKVHNAILVYALK